jgi:MFS family permease
MSQIALINALNASFGIIFTLNAMWTADRYGRKFLFIVGAAGMASCMLAVAIIGRTTPTLPGDKKSEGVGRSIVAMLFLFIFFFKPSELL